MVRVSARAWVAGLLVLVSLAAAGCTQTPSSSVIVMTRNLYLGGDITRPVRAAQGLTGAEALLALGHANHELADLVGQTDFGVRSRLLAAEIAAARPDLVGLQEVALWRHGPMQLDQLGRVDASEVDEDFLARLLAALSERQVSYRVVHEQTESDVEAPAFTGDPLSGAAGSSRDVRLTVRDVILVRDGSPATIRASGGGSYARRLAVPLGGVPFAFVRGFAWADVAIGASRFRFLTTHLESQSADLALAQAGELLTGPAADRQQTTVLVCDCNSDPSTTVALPGQPAADAAAYELLTGRGAFHDPWPEQDEGPGLTGVLSERLTDPDAAGLTRRLDLVLTRSSSPAVTARRGRLTGNVTTDRDPGTGLWPSDHAGVVFELDIR